MTNSDINEIVRKIISKQLELKIDLIQPQSTPENLGADSLDQAEIMLDVEDAFGIEFPDSAWGKIKTVGELVKFVEDQTKNLF